MRFCIEYINEVIPDLVCEMGLIKIGIITFIHLKKKQQTNQPFPLHTPRHNKTKNKKKKKKKKKKKTSFLSSL